MAKAAKAQVYVPIPNEISGPLCPAGCTLSGPNACTDLSQCAGYKLRNDFNNKLNGTDNITPKGNFTGTVNGRLNANLFSGNDIGIKVNSAIATIGSVGGTVYIPAGTYSFATTINRPGNVTIEGDPGATFLQYTGSGDAIASLGPSHTPPSQTIINGGVRDLTFQGHINSGTADPANVHLIHLSNMLRQIISDVEFFGYGNAGDVAVYIDTGDGPGGTTFSEGNVMRNIQCDFITSCVVFDGNGFPSSSTNNNFIVGSLYNSSYFNAGAGVSFINQAVAASSQIQLSGNLNFAGTSAFLRDATGNPNDVEFHGLFQGIAGTFCFSGGNFVIVNGQVTCYPPTTNGANTMVAFRDHPFTAGAFIPTTSGIALNTFYAGYNLSFSPSTVTATSVGWSAQTPGVGCTTEPHIQLYCGAAKAASDQKIANNTGSGFIWDFESCGSATPIGVIITTAAAGCSTYPANINVTVGLAPTATSQ